MRTRFGVALTAFTLIAALSLASPVAAQTPKDSATVRATADSLAKLSATSSTSTAWNRYVQRLLGILTTGFKAAPVVPPPPPPAPPTPPPVPPTAPPVVPAPIAALTVTPSTIAQGGSATLAGSCLNAVSQVISLGSQTSPSSSPPSGTWSTQTSTPGTYSLICTAADRRADTAKATLVLGGAPPVTPPPVTPPSPPPVTPPSPPPPSTPPVPSSMFFNSSEVGCGTDSKVVLCDDFERSTWYSKNCDQANGSGGLLQTAGWCGTIYGSASALTLCGNQGFRSNCAAQTSQAMFADHSLSQGVTNLYVRYYQKMQLGYSAGAEKVLAFNNGQAGVGGIYGGNLHMNCGAGGASSTATLQWQPVAPEDGCKTILSMSAGRWYFVEVHYNGPGGQLQVWADDCGDGSSCPSTPTLRLNLTGYRLPSGAINSLWFENWSNPSSSGIRLIDQIKVSKSGPIGFMK